MARPDLSLHVQRVDNLAQDINAFVPSEQLGVTGFRADLAGLLVVGIAASYEACVRETLIRYAERHHNLFAQFTANRYAKLSSKVAIGDLHGYAKMFDPSINDKFKDILKARCDSISLKTGKNIKTCYEQILSWRHDYAHEGKKNTTIEEAILTHTYGKRVIFAFNKAFSD